VAWISPQGTAEAAALQRPFGTRRSQATIPGLKPWAISSSLRDKAIERRALESSLPTTPSSLSSSSCYELLPQLPSGALRFRRSGRNLSQSIHSTEASRGRSRCPASRKQPGSAMHPEDISEHVSGPSLTRTSIYRGKAAVRGAYLSRVHATIGLCCSAIPNSDCWLPACLRRI